MGAWRRRAGGSFWYIIGPNCLGNLKAKAITNACNYANRKRSEFFWINSRTLYYIRKGNNAMSHPQDQLVVCQLFYSAKLWNSQREMLSCSWADETVECWRPPPFENLSLCVDCNFLKKNYYVGYIFQSLFYFTDIKSLQYFFYKKFRKMQFKQSLKFYLYQNFFL